jgi:hypothetical protein
MCVAPFVFFQYMVYEYASHIPFTSEHFFVRQGNRGVPQIAVKKD